MNVEESVSWVGELAGPAAVEWGSSQRALRVQVLGAVTAVGRELTLNLLQAGHPASHLQLVGRKERTLSWQQETLQVNGFHRPLGPVDLVFLCSSHADSNVVLQHHLDRGAWLVDLTGRYRQRADVPLVADGANLESLGAFTQVVALPTRTAVLAAQPLAVVERVAGLAEVQCVALCSAAAEGTRGIIGLREELAHVEGHAGAARVGNLIPSLADPGAGGESIVEQALSQDLRRLFDRPDLPIDVTAIDVDAERCDGLAFHLRLQRPIPALDLARELAAVPWLCVEPSPTTLGCQGSDRVHVGRIRAGSGGAASVCFFAVGDQLRFGAALAAMRVASRLPAA